MLLLIDIGNTNITTGFWDKRIKNIMRLSTGLSTQYIEKVMDFISRHRIKKPDAAVICSVVPHVTPLLIEAMKEKFDFKPIVVNHKLKTGLKFCIKNPEELGADRIANAVAAHKLYKGNLIVIDFGTATTFCVISAKGEYKGGVIMPGLGISVDALAEHTAKLPKIELKAPKRILGNDTVSNILSGVVLGHAGAVERIIKEIKARGLSCGRKINKRTTANVIATGGFAGLVVPYIKGIKEVNPLLTLEGLRIIHELNV